MPKRRIWTITSGSDLGRAIAELRSIRGLTQQELAERAAISRPYLAKLEAGLSVVLLERALRMIRRLGADVTVTLRDSHEDAD